MLKKTLGAVATFIALGSILSASVQATAVEGFDNTQHSLTEPNSPWVLVNKKNPLNPKNYVPKNLVVVAKNNPSGLRLAKPAADAFITMIDAAKKAGAGKISVASGYRSYKRQIEIHDADVRKFGLIAGEKLAARPGFSEHQTGLAVDIYELNQGCRIRVCFGATKAGTWVRKNAWQYGFIVRYPDGSYPTTGYQYEPWHLRYVGIELATELHAQGVTILEKYWNYPAAPKY